MELEMRSDIHMLLVGLSFMLCSGCSEREKKSAPTVNYEGITIGMSEAEVVALIGRPLEKTRYTGGDERWVYLFPRPQRSSDGQDVGGVIIIFIERKVAKISPTLKTIRA